MKTELLKLLSDYDKSKVDRYISYLEKLFTEKDKTGKLKNWWVSKKSAEYFSNLFSVVDSEGLEIDGKHITIQSTGLSFDYIAYKNKMLLAYPDSKIDVMLVKQDDEFSFEKHDGKVVYSHKLGNPFGNKEIIGAYVVIKNKRGEFITLLSRADIEKHRKVAKTDYIWKQWFEEMSLKTVIKKACKLHFADVFEKIEEKDNENYNIETPVNLDLSVLNKIKESKTEQELTDIYNENKDKVKDKKGFVSFLTKKKEELKNGI